MSGIELIHVTLESIGGLTVALHTIRWYFKDKKPFRKRRSKRAHSGYRAHVRKIIAERGLRK